MVAPELEIVITAGGCEVLRCTVRPGEYVIGSAESADLCVALPEIAGRHALLTVNFDHTLIETLDGSDAVRINGQPIQECTRLWPNQKVQVGTATVSLRRKKSAAEPDMTMAPAAWTPPARPAAPARPMSRPCARASPPPGRTITRAGSAGFFADPATRTASAFSAVPMSTALDQLTAIGTLSELEEARRRPTDLKIMTLLAQKYREKSEPAATALADFLAAFAAWNATTGTAARILEAQKQMRVAR